VATENNSGGESRAKKVIEQGTNIHQTNAGDIFIMHPNGYSTAGLEIDEDELASCIRDYKELNLEKDFRDFSDWESGMIQSQVDMIVCSMKNEIGCEVSGVQALEVKNALLQNGILQSRIIENNYTENEIWDPADGMDAPVEQIAQDIVKRNIQQDIKRKYSLLMPLSVDDLKDVAAQCGKIRIYDFAMGGQFI